MKRQRNWSSILFWIIYLTQTEARATGPNSGSPRPVIYLFDCLPRKSASESWLRLNNGLSYRLRQSRLSPVPLRDMFPMC